MTASGFRYAAYGLAVESAIALPFRQAGAEGPADVTIRIGSVPETTAPADDGRPWRAVPGVFRLEVDRVGRYLVEAGREITVEPTAGSDGDVRTFLLGSVFGACLQQRGILTLHASAVETARGAALFAGPSGAGKSTLAAALVDRGFRLLADDVTGVVLDARRRPVALSAIPAVRLWADAREALAWTDRTSGPTRAGIEKHVAPVEHFCPAPLAIHAVHLVRSHNRSEIEVESVPRAASFQALLNHTYRGRFLCGPARHGEHFRALSALANLAPVTRLGWPSHPFRPLALADAVERRLRAAA